MQSPSLELGRSFLPDRGIAINSFVSHTATAIKRNPDVAAEIALAATDHLLGNFPTSTELRIALSQLVSASCKARDESTLA